LTWPLRQNIWCRPIFGAVTLPFFQADAGDGKRRRQRFHVVDDGGLLEEAVGGGEGRFDAREAAFAFDGLEERGLFAANVSAGAQPHFNVKVKALAAEQIAPR
jgi:hypothetical protein